MELKFNQENGQSFIIISGNGDSKGLSYKFESEEVRDDIRDAILILQRNYMLIKPNEKIKVKWPSERKQMSITGTSTDGDEVRSCLVTIKSNEMEITSLNDEEELTEQTIKDLKAAINKIVLVYQDRKQGYEWYSCETAITQLWKQDEWIGTGLAWYEKVYDGMLCDVLKLRGEMVGNNTIRITDPRRRITKAFTAVPGSNIFRNDLLSLVTLLSATAPASTSMDSNIVIIDSRITKEYDRRDLIEKCMLILENWSRSKKITCSIIHG